MIILFVFESGKTICYFSRFFASKVARGWNEKRMRSHLGEIWQTSCKISFLTYIQISFLAQCGQKTWHTLSPIIRKWKLSAWHSWAGCSGIRRYANNFMGFGPECGRHAFQVWLSTAILCLLFLFAFENKKSIFGGGGEDFFFSYVVGADSSGEEDKRLY